jgi:hypothetical protein
MGRFAWMLLSISPVILSAQPAAPKVPADFGEVLSLASRDCRRLPASIQKQTRYLSLYNLPASEWSVASKVLSFHCNSLSLAPDIVVPRVVSGSNGSLLAIVLGDYEWDRDKDLWEKLAKVDPYWHVQITRNVDAVGRNEQGEQMEKTERRTSTALAPWLIESRQSKDALTELVALTKSQVPIVRADWFVWQTAIQADRVPGYYDFIGAKDEKEYLERVGFDAKILKRFPKELREAVSKSGVARQPRRIEFFGTVGGGLWKTDDVKKADGTKNPLRLLRDEFQPDAHEWIAAGPNGLHVYFLSDAKGQRQDSAPDFIGPDSLAHSHDGRIHAGLSCVRCHGPNAGINPIDGWIRGLGKGKLGLQSPDYETYRELRRLYESKIEPVIGDSRRLYRRAVKEANGWGPEENAKRYSELFAREDDSVDGDRAADDLGVTKQRLLDVLDREVKVAGGLDTALAGFLSGDSLPIDVWHDSYAQVQLLLKKHR